MSHCDDHVGGGDEFAEIYIEGAKLDLDGGWHDGFDDLGDGEDSFIVGRVDGVVGEG